MSGNCFPFASKSQNIHESLKGVQSKNVKFECTLSISFRANDLLLFQHLSIVLTLDLTQDLNASLSYYLLLFNLVAAVFNRRREQLGLVFFLELKIVEDAAERPVSTVVLVRLIVDELGRF